MRAEAWTVVADADGAPTTLAFATALATTVGALAFSRPAAERADAADAGRADAALCAERTADAALGATVCASAVLMTSRAPAGAAGVRREPDAAAVRCDGVERPPSRAGAGLETWVSVPVSAAATPDPPVKAAPANAAPTPSPTAPAPSQEYGAIRRDFARPRPSRGPAAVDRGDAINDSDVMMLD